jgi:hypothetical protein
MKRHSFRGSEPSGSVFFREGHVGTCVQYKPHFSVHSTHYRHVCLCPCVMFVPRRGYKIAKPTFHLTIRLEERE